MLQNYMCIDTTREPVSENVLHVPRNHHTKKSGKSKGL